MSRKEQRRFTSEEQILEAIERNKSYAKLKNIEADRYEIFAEEIFKMESSPARDGMIENAKFRKMRAAQLRESAQRNLDKAHLLGIKLAQFRTALLPGCGEDRSIPQ